MDARANAQRLSRSAAVACLRVLTAFALALVCSIRCFFPGNNDFPQRVTTNELVTTNVTSQKRARVLFFTYFHSRAKPKNGEMAKAKTKKLSNSILNRLKFGKPYIRPLIQI